MQNFKSVIPENVQNKIKELSDYIHENMSDMVQGFQSNGFVMEPTLQVIEGNYKSGWIPNQDGGFSVDVFCRNDQDSSYHFTEKQTEYAQAQAKNCFSSFLSDNNLDSDTSYEDLTEEQKESLCNYESDWNDPALLQFQIFIEDIRRWESGEKQIVMRVSINYKDAPYYREKYAEDIKQVILDTDEFMQKPINEIIDDLKI